jgi:hypothetical protein
MRKTRYFAASIVERVSFFCIRVPNLATGGGQ